MKKTFDCVEMKRKIQERIYEETRGLSREEELAYFHRAAEAFWREIASLRKGEPVDLSERGIGPEQAADLRARLKSFESDWHRPEMDAYDAL